MAHEQELMALAVALYKDGELIGHIKRKLGISRQTLYNWLRDAGIEPGRYQTSSGSNLDHKLKKYATYLVDRAIAGDQDPEAMLKEFSKYVREGIEFRKNRTVSSPVHRDPVIAMREEVEFAPLPPGTFEPGAEYNQYWSESYKGFENTKAPDGSPLKLGEWKKMRGEAFPLEALKEVSPPAEDELYDIVAEDLKKICRMCGNMLNTEFCCTWEG